MPKSPSYNRMGSLLRTASQNQPGLVKFATIQEADAGILDDVAISPATLADAINDLVPIITSITLAGATNENVPSTLAAKTYIDNIAIAGAPAASESVSGIAELATQAEAVAGLDDLRIVTPLKAKQILAAPSAIGGTTPAAGAFTTLSSSGLYSAASSATILTAGTALNLASDADTAAVNVGTGAAARVITIGNVSGATSVNINTGTGSFNVATTGTGDIIMNAADTMLLDSAGVLELNSSAGVIGIGNDAVAQAINIGTGAAARTITLGNSSGATSVVLNCGTGALNLGTNAVAHTVTIGNSTGASALALLTGTGNFSLDGVAGSTYTFGAATTTGTMSFGGTAQTGTMTIGGSNGAMTLNMANADGVKTINIGSGVSGNAISIGNGVNTGAQTINISNGASAANTTLNIMSGIGTAGAGVIALGSNTRVTTMGICNIAPAAARTVTVCGGNSAQNDTFTLMGGNPSASLQTVNILSGVPSGGTQVLNLLTQTGQAGLVNIGTGAAMANAIVIGGTGANVVTIADTQTAGSLSIGNAMTTGTVNIGSTGAGTGTGTLFGGTGAQTVSLCNNTGIKTINIAGDAATSANVLKMMTGAGAQTVTIGSTNTTSALTLQAGTGKITMTGTVKSIIANHVFSSGTDLTVTQSPLLQSNATTGVAPTGAAGDINLMAMQDGCIMEQFIIGTQTIIAPRMASTGLNLMLDNTSTEGAEYNFGARSNAKHAYTIGTSAAFFIEASFAIQDVSGCEPLVIGFRKVQANSATFGDYTDFVSIGIQASTSAGNVSLVTQIGSGGIVATNTTDAWADAATKTVKVLVSAAGVVTYTIDGVAPTSTAAYTFTNALEVMPFIRCVEGADITTYAGLKTLKIGFQ